MLDFFPLVTVNLRVIYKKMSADVIK